MTEVDEMRSAPQQLTIRNLNGEGDTHISWTPGNADEVRTAREHFEKLTGELKYSAYRVVDGERGELIREFDPAAEEIILAPQISGG